MLFFINYYKLIIKLYIKETTTTTEIAEEDIKAAPKRDEWGNQLEFLMSCIACSVGLGNVWRFPFTALENGGGAFVIPYIIVLIVVGKPIYYLEMLIGQFSSRGNIKVYDISPAMRGIFYLYINQISSNAFVYVVYRLSNLHQILRNWLWTNTDHHNRINILHIINGTNY